MVALSMDGIDDTSEKTEILKIVLAVSQRHLDLGKKMAMNGLRA